MSVLKVKIAGQRIKYEIMKVTFSESDLQKAKGWNWVKKGNSLCFCENKLDIIKDYDTFDSVNAGVAIRTTGEIYYELGNEKGKIITSYELSPNHPMLIAIEDAHKSDGLTLTTANVYDKKNTIYEYTIDVGDGEVFDVSLLKIIAVRCPISNEQYIVDVWYDYNKMTGRIDELPFKGEPLSKKSMLTVPKDYADALGLAESGKLDNLMRFEDFIKEENAKSGKKPVDKVKLVKDYCNISEDYIHSFINEHERDHEPEEE